MIDGGSMVVRPARRHRLRAVWAIGTIATVAVAGCNSSAPPKAAVSSGSYNVFALEPLSGAVSALGKAEMEGAQAAVAYLNAHGGFDGRQVKFFSADDQGSSTTAISLLTKQLDGSEVPNLVIAGASTAETDAVTPILKQHKILSAEPVARVKSADPNYAPYDFSVLMTSAAANAATANAVISKGYKTIGILTSDDAYGSQTEPTWKAPLEAAGVKVVTASFPAGATSVTSELAQLKSGGAQALLVAAEGSDAGTVTTSRAQVGWYVPTYGSPAFSNSGVAALVPAADLKDLYLFTYAVSVAGSPIQKRPIFSSFMQYLEKSVSPVSQVLALYAFGWDSVAIPAMAAKQVGSTDTTKVTGGMLALNPSDPALNVSFSPLKFDSKTHTVLLPADNSVLIPASTPIIHGVFSTQPG